MPENKKKLLDALLQKLMAHNAHVNATKIKFINFQQVREYIGAGWKRVENIVHSIALDAIERHTGPKDLFFRFNDDDYLIIFASTNKQENNKTCMLIADEIRQSIFEQAKEHKELSKINLDYFMTEIPTADLNSKEGLLDMLCDKMNKKDEENPEDNAEDTEDFLSSADTFFVGVPSRAKPAQGKNVQHIKAGTHSEYSPMLSALYDVKRGAFGTLVCIINDTRISKVLDPVQNYMSLFEDSDYKTIAQHDTLALRHSVKMLSQKKYHKSFYVSCPVHFETLTSAASFATYHAEAQILHDAERKRLSFILLNVPDDVPNTTLSKIVNALKLCGYSVTLMIGLKTRSNFSDYVNCRVDGLGYIILDHNLAIEKEYEAAMARFVDKAHVINLRASLILNKPSSIIYKAAITAGIDFIGGEAVCKAVDTPDKLTLTKEGLTAAS